MARLWRWHALCHRNQPVLNTVRGHDCNVLQAWFAAIFDPDSERLKATELTTSG